MAEDSGGGVRITDPRVMRALAHPARIEIVDYLNTSGAVVTATECAAMVGLSPSATSYHLRELAKYGLVEQAPSRGDGRERVWRGVGPRVSIEGDLAEPEARASQRALVELYLQRDAGRVRDWLDRQPDDAKAWQDASTITEMMLLLTAEELADINERISTLLSGYRYRTRQGEKPEGARKVHVSYLAFPAKPEGEAD